MSKPYVLSWIDKQIVSTQDSNYYILLSAIRECLCQTSKEPFTKEEIIAFYKGIAPLQNAVVRDKSALPIWFKRVVGSIIVELRKLQTIKGN